MFGREVSLSCVLFNIPLERAIHDSNVNSSGCIFSRSVQLVVYADDINVIAQILPPVREAFLALKLAASQMGLVIYFVFSSFISFSKNRVPDSYPETDFYKFETVKCFTYFDQLLPLRAQYFQRSRIGYIWKIMHFKD